MSDRDRHEQPTGQGPEAQRAGQAAARASPAELVELIEAHHEATERLQQAQSERQRDVAERLGPQMSEKSQKYQEFMGETFGPGGIIESHTDEIMEPLYDKLEQACRKVGKQLQIPLILDLQTVGPLYMADTLDLTDEVLAELKKIW